MEPTVVKGIPVTCEAAILNSGVTIDTVVSCKPFREWLDEMDRERFKIRSVHIQAVNIFAGPRVGFVMFKADVVDANDRFVPGVVFMRGGAVAILPVLICNGTQHAVLAVQPRLPTGRFDFVEIPAGMLDDSGNFYGPAADLLKDELNMTVAIDELINLSELAGHSRGHFPSPGGCEETIRVYCFIRHVTEDELAKIRGRFTSNPEHGKQITLKVAPLADLWKIPDGKTVVAYALFRELEASILPR